MAESAGKRQLCDALRATGYEELCAPVESGSLTAVFSFGSNNVEQLRARLQANKLAAIPAFVPHHQLIFSGPNKSWSLGGRLANVAVASLRFAPEDPAARALGNCVLLTPKQLARLDGFEGVAYRVYQHTVVSTVLVGENGATQPFPAIAYTRLVTDQFGDGPAEAYLCAIKRNLQASFPAADITIPIRNGDGQLLTHNSEEWRHPGFAGLSLPAFLYEVGVRKARPWEMPKAITEVVEKFEAIGVPHSTTKPRELVERIEEVNARLVEAGQLAFSEEVVGIMRELVETAGYRL